MDCSDRDCQKKLDEVHQEIYGHNNSGGIKECVGWMKKEINKKVSIPFLIILFVSVAIPVTVYAWVLSTNHESRICVIEKQQKEFKEMKETTDKIYKILKGD